MSKIVKKASEFILAFLPAAAWAIVIYYLSDQQVLPSFSLSTWDFLFKKTAHMIAYGILYLLVFRGFKLTAKFTDQKRWLIPLLIVVAYATFDEFHQSFVPGRTGTIRDIGFDLLGCNLVLMKKFGYI